MEEDQDGSINIDVQSNTRDNIWRSLNLEDHFKTRLIEVLVFALLIYILLYIAEKFS